MLFQGSLYSNCRIQPPIEQDCFQEKRCLHVLTRLQLQITFSVMSTTSKIKQHVKAKTNIIILRRWRKRNYHTPNCPSNCIKHSNNPSSRPREIYHAVSQERLLKLSQQLSRKNLDDLKFLASSILSEGELAHIESSTQLVQSLHQAGHLVGGQDTLKHWLVEIGRSDLAGELPGRLAEVERYLLPSERRERLHRYRLLEVSESLRRDEVRRLVYLCPILPQSLYDSIKEGIQLFQELEQRGRLGTDNYGYLIECLEQLGRVDLATKLACRKVPWEGVPVCPRSFGVAEQVFRFFCRQKRQSYESRLTELTDTTTQQAWLERSREVMPRIIATCSRKVPLATNEAIANLSPEIVDDVIKDTLEAMFSFLMSEAEVIVAIMEGDTCHLKQSSSSCKTRYAEFDATLDQFGWNAESRQRVSEKCQERKGSHGKAAENVSTSIQSFCTEFLGEDKVQQSIFSSTIDNIHHLESKYYHVWQQTTMLEWATDIINLGSSSVIDLSRHKSTLARLVLQHRYSILHAMPLLSQVLDMAIIDQVTSLLSKAILSSGSHADETSLQSKTGCHHIATSTQRWCLILLELVGVANGYRVNHREITEAYSKHLYSKPNLCSQMLQAGMEIAASVTRSMHTQVAVCKETAEKAASLGPRGCSDVISELFR